MILFIHQIILNQVKLLNPFKVNKALKKGDYTIYMNIETYSMDGENTRMNGASVKANLQVV